MQCAFGGWVCLLDGLDCTGGFGLGAACDVEGCVGGVENVGEFKTDS